MKKLLEFILSEIVDNPKDVIIEESSQGGEGVFNIKANPDDVGKVIGKKGQIIRAIRTLVKTRAVKDGKRVQVNLLVP